MVLGVVARSKIVQGGRLVCGKNQIDFVYYVILEGDWGGGQTTSLGGNVLQPQPWLKP